MSLSSLYLVFFSLLQAAMAINTSHPLKSMHFALYQHDIFNKTDFNILRGPVGPGLGPTTSPFGSIFVLRDQLTTTPNPSSKVVGIVEGFTVTSSFDGLDNISVGKITLNLKDRKGSISTAGVFNNVKPSNTPVIGGTGDFLFVQGYVTTSLVSFDGSTTFLFKVEFHLYWPPYASQANII